MKKCGGTTKADKGNYLRNVSFLYRSWVFTAEEGFQTKFSIFYTKFSSYPSAKQFIVETSFEKRKICCFLHKTHFRSGTNKQSKIRIYE